MPLITTLFLIVFTSICFAQSYVPYVPKTALPPDLQKQYSQLSAVQYQGSIVVTMDMANNKLFLDSRIAEMLNSIGATNGHGVFVDFFDCAIDLELQAIKNNTSLSEVYLRGVDLCLKLSKPEAFFNKGVLFEPGLLKMKALKDVIETVITPTFLQNTPFSYFDQKTTHLIRSALLRIKFEVVMKHFSDMQQTIYKHLKESTQISSQEAQALRNMQSKLSSQSQVVAAWNEKGKSQFKDDVQQAQKRNPSRGTLPYNNMPDLERKTLTMYLYAMMWRFRGGGFIPLNGTQLARIFYAQLPYKLLAELNGLDSINASNLGANMFGRLVTHGWSGWMDIGRNHGENEAHDLAYMSVRGLQQTQEVEMALKSLGFDASIVKYYSAHFGICYLYAWEKLDKVLVHPKPSKPYSGFFDGATSWGEHCAGAAFGLGLSETLL